MTNRLAPGDQLALALSTTAGAVTAELSPSDFRRNTWARLAPHHVVVECSYLDPTATPSALASCPRGKYPTDLTSARLYFVDAEGEFTSAPQVVPGIPTPLCM